MESFSALSDFLLHLKNSNQQNANTNKVWYECTITPNPIEKSIIAFENEPSLFTSCFVEKSSSEEYQIVKNNSVSSSCSHQLSGSLVAVAIQEQKSNSSLAVVTIMLQEQFVKSAAEHCDVLFKEFLRQQRKTKSAVSLDTENEIEKLMLVRLFLAPNSYQCWNVCRELFTKKCESIKNENNNNNSSKEENQKLFLQFWKEEMNFNAIVFARVPKSPESWFQRTWLMTKLFHEISPADSNLLHLVSEILHQESFIFGFKACLVYRRNYPAWEYRRRIWMDFGIMEKLILEPLLFEKYFFECELKQTLNFFEKNPGDASAVSYFSNLLLKVIRQQEQHLSSPSLKMQTQQILDEAWNLSQKMIRGHCRVQIIEANLFSISQLSHEAIWFFRRALVEASFAFLLRNGIKNNPKWKNQEIIVLSENEDASDVVLYRGWTLKNEIDFVGTIVESQEMALKLAQTEEEEKQEVEATVVKMIPLNKQDFASVDQGSFAVVHALQYLIWLLR
jgi:hypothetical protein